MSGQNVQHSPAHPPQDNRRLLVHACAVTTVPSSLRSLTQLYLATLRQVLTRISDLRLLLDGLTEAGGRSGIGILLEVSFAATQSSCARLITNGGRARSRQQ